LAWLLLVLVVVGIPLLAFVADLGLLDSARTRARVDAILREAERQR
jgi:hypothetical protein